MHETKGNKEQMGNQEMFTANQPQVIRLNDNNEPTWLQRNLDAIKERYDGKIVLVGRDCIIAAFDFMVDAWNCAKLHCEPGGFQIMNFKHKN